MAFHVLFVLAQRINSETKTSLINTEGSPAAIESLRVSATNDQLEIEYQLVNKRDVALVRLQSTIIIKDLRGRVVSTQLDELPSDFLPIPAGSTRTVRQTLRSVVNQGDELAVGISLAADDADLWTEDLVSYLERSKTLEDATKVTNESVLYQPPITINVDDSPLQITDVLLVRDSNGKPLLVRITVRNSGQEPIVVSRVQASLFSEKHAERTRMFVPERRPLAPGGVRTSELVVHHSDITSKWTVVVAVQEADTITHKWMSADLKDRVQKALESRRP